MVRQTKTSVERMAVGASYFWKGQRFVWKEHRELLVYVAWPMIIGALCSIGGAALLFSYAEVLVQNIWHQPDWWLLKALWHLVYGLMVIAGLAIVVLASALAFYIAAAPFNDLISEMVEGITGTWETAPFSIRFLVRDLRHSIVVEMVKAAKKLMWLLPLYLFSLLVPVLGHVAYIIIGGYRMSVMLGLDFIDWSLARRGYSWRERLAFSKMHRHELVGFGLLMTLALVIPLGGIVFWPGAVAGGTLLCTAHNPEDKRPQAMLKREGD